ncbi:penicillin acylase family protein [Pseudooceanicola sp. CBS1P-1]|uniref:Penicillin acylase family protein n=1 Tax=Pseudooceanicola albus TaxID=2692189 RepID=A0A6L7FXG7_9RHOB|nr:MULTISPECIES: penicillin acylase family protein [Pseudooceanicola]MBT9383232.1 penicillin acylase family protein [Pseudooceanicola endophyticus]MXN16445.1 penicillin acylase family protein [Pseudooceanicola albus]
MRFVFRWLLRIAGTMVIIAVLGAGLAYFLAARSLPTYDKTLRVSGISAPVDIVRDNADVPHIFGASDPDVFFGLGYAHAQDRLWQMIMLRRTVEGRLSEIFGTRTLPIDKLMRRYDLYKAAQASVSAQDPRTLAALKAYSAGVNARLDEINKDSLGRGAPEMFLFNVPVAPWTPADSIAIGKLMALEMDGSLASEVERARVSLALPDQKMVDDILPQTPGAPLTALPDYAQLMQAQGFTQYASAQGDGLPADPLSPFPAPGLEGASNAFAAAPQRSATGGTLLANDPHLGFTAPSIWYLARLQLQQGGVIGATIPGLPLVLSGRSQFLGWGLTSSGLDDLDVYMEELNPDHPQEYRTPDGWKPFVTRKTIISIKDAAPVTLTLRWTDNGPVLPGSFYNLDTVTPPGHVAAINWTALSDHDTTLSAGVELMYAKNVQQGIEAGKLQIAPSQNLMLADATSIAFKTIGAVPARNPAHDSQGRMPTLGWKPENRWNGYFPYADNPEIVNPESGILGNTNNKVTDAPFPHNITFDWGDTQRIHRWQKLMESRKVHTRDSFIEAQLDTVSFTARSLLPLIGRNLWYNGDPAPKGTPERMRQDALKMLADWNGDMNEHMPEPLIYAVWISTLQDRLIRDELGPIADEFTHVDPVFIERVFRNIDGASKWCDVVQTETVETCDQIAQQSLDAALLWIKERYGDNLESLRWGDVHQAAQDHPVLGEVPILKYLVNIRQRTSGGDNTLNRGATKGTGPDPFLDVHGAGYRGVYDFADPDSSVFIISTGQSGHPLSRHYDDLGELWRRGEYIPMSLDTALARAASVGETKLVPGN